MPFLHRPDGKIHYEESGAGYPVLALAPGWLRSAAARWTSEPGRVHSWLDWPAILAPHYRVIAMDQRNAGASSTRIEADHGWHCYIADQIALMDHLGHDRFHVVGACIGASFALGICQAQPGRVTAMVLPQPIGLHPEHPRHFPDRFEGWTAEILAARPDLDPAALESFGRNMWDGEFVYSVSRDSAGSCPTPALVMPGDNEPHPEVIGRELAELMPNGELYLDWKAPDFADRQRDGGLDFLARNTPGPT